MNTTDSSSLEKCLPESKRLETQIRRIWELLYPGEYWQQQLESILSNADTSDKKIHVAAFLVYKISNYCLVCAWVEASLIEQPATEAVGLESFHCFSTLPMELRLRVWEMAILPQIRSKVRCIKAANPLPREILRGFRSNQPISPIVQTCQESRKFYISRTKSQFAFGTYISFQEDLVYLCDNKLCAPEMFVRLISCAEYTHEIKNLAMPESMLLALAQPTISLNHQKLRCYFPLCETLIMVFYEERPTEIIWQDRNLCFKEFSDRDRRRSWLFNELRAFLQSPVFENQPILLENKAPLKYMYAYPVRKD